MEPMDNPPPQQLVAAPPSAGPPPPGQEGEAPSTSPSTPLKDSDRLQVTSDKQENPPRPPFAKGEGAFDSSLVTRHMSLRLDPIPLDRPVVERAAKELTNRVNSFLKKLAKSVADQVVAIYEEHLAKAKRKPPGGGDGIDELDYGDWKVLFDVTAEYAAKVAADSGFEALKQLRISDEGITSLVHERAVEFAKERAAELIGMRYDKQTGQLVENPNPKWAIEDSTRDMLRSSVAKALEEGPTVQDLRNEIIDSYAFSPERAEMIARTELAIAHSKGSVEGYKAAEGLGFHTMKEWLVSQDEPEDECMDNADQGPIEMDEAFVSGDFEPPAHPNCKCAIMPYVVEAPEDWVEPGK
jgi:hypothetical protein